MTTTTVTPAADTLSRLQLASNIAMRAVERQVCMSASAYKALAHIVERATVEPCELADALHVTRPSVTGLLDTLRALGLAERTPHPTDRRRLMIVATAEGIAYHETCGPLYQQAAERVLSRLTADQRHALDTILAVLTTEDGEQ